MEYTYNGLIRWGFGFHNPNHAAAAICAILPFLWGFGLRVDGCGLRVLRPVKWVGLVLSVALFGMLALTYSRTGFLVAAMEIIVWAMATRRRSAVLLFLCLGGAALAGGMAARFVPDAAVMNRPEIWWAGLKLAAANPSGVGSGNSGLLVSTFLLDGIEVRTLVNSHLTLFAEQGWIVGCIWMAFLAVALAGGWRRYPRLWIAFAGLTVSAFASSVFDWHVLFDFTSHGGLGMLNFLFSWALFASFLVVGAVLALDVADGGAFASGRWWSDLAKRLFVALAAAVAAMMIRHFVPVMGVPKVRDGLVVQYGREMPLVLHDATWTMKAVLPYLENGYCIAIAPGYVETEMQPESVWLFGMVAESAHRFPEARITVVDPPEFCPLPPNAEIR